MTELELLEDADRRARAYVDSVRDRAVFPGDTALSGLTQVDEPLPLEGLNAEDTLRMLDEVGGPATVVSSGPRAFGRSRTLVSVPRVHTGLTAGAMRCS